MIRKLPLVLLTILFAACSGSDDKKSTKKKAAKEKAIEVIPPTVFEKGLAEFTGAHTKVVWSQYQKQDKSDKQGTSRHAYLMALDSANGLGEYKVLEEKANYAYPIISPDGKFIVFTRKNKVKKDGKRKFDAEIELVNFDGTGLRKLGKGYAQEIWEEPETGRYWIYAGDEFRYHAGTAPICKRIIRFPLDDLSKREVVWDKTEVGTDSFAISADGKRFAALFPWPTAGMGNLETNDWEKLDDGCWVSMAPDNSYDMWVFDGPHRNLFMYDANGTKTATVQVNSHPAMKGDETYHPRWGNHRHFFALTGPHIFKKVPLRGKPVEVFLGKFAPELDRVEAWFQVTNNDMPDNYPDVWIDPSAERPEVAKAAPVKPSTVKSDKWPSNPDGLVFKWENTKAKNEFTAPDGSNQVTKLEPRGFSHYGPNYEMVIANGSFEPILESEAFAYPAARSAPCSFQCLITANKPNGEIWNFGGGITLFLKDSRLYLDMGNGQHQEFPEIKLGVPTHFSLNLDSNSKYMIYINGKGVGSKQIPAPASNPRADTFNIGHGFDGTLSHLAFYNRSQLKAQVLADYAAIRTALEKRKSIERREVKGKLVFMSPLPEVELIKPYVRALVHYIYEVDGEKIAVAHWAILDSKPVAGLPSEIGKTYDLTIEPKEAHKQLTSQAESTDEDQIDFSMSLFYDVKTPQK